MADSKERKLPVFRSPMITKDFVNLATLCIDNEFALSTVEHATTLDVRGNGTLLRGDSGVGTSECALARIEQLQQLRLGSERELGDLVQKKSPPLRRRHLPRHLARRRPVCATRYAATHADA